MEHVEAKAPSAPSLLTENFMKMSQEDRKEAANQLMEITPGLFSLDKVTRRAIWVGILILFGVAMVAAFLLIVISWKINVTTTSGTGQDTVTSTIHPDMTAAWAIIAAVVAGLVGILVPSTNSK